MPSYTTRVTLEDVATSTFAPEGAARNPRLATDSMPNHVREAFAELAEQVAVFDGRMYATGSRVIGGWTEQSDWDYVVTVRDIYGLKNRLLVQMDWSTGGSDQNNSLKKGGVNAIVVYNEHEFLMWQAATMAAKALGLTDRDERVAFFEAMKNGGTSALQTLMTLREVRDIETTISESEGAEPAEASGDTNPDVLSGPIF